MLKQELLEKFRKKGFPEKVISAFSEVRREDFVPEHLVPYAYDDIPVPVDDGSTISQPSTLALMLELLDVNEGQVILEIGSGSGYALALLSSMVKKGSIFGLEINKRLAIISKKRLSNDKNIHIINKDGSKGLPSLAPFDRILISASCPEKPYHLIGQLMEGGIIVAAVADTIVCIKKVGGVMEEKVLPGYAFVPLRKS